MCSFYSLIRKFNVYVQMTSNIVYYFTLITPCLDLLKSIYSSKSISLISCPCFEKFLIMSSFINVLIRFLMFLYFRLEFHWKIHYQAAIWCSTLKLVLLNNSDMEATWKMKIEVDSSSTMSKENQFYHFVFAWVLKYHIIVDVILNNINLHENNLPKIPSS